MRATDTYSFINKATSIHGQKYDYSKVEYVKSTSHVNIICPKHGIFKQKPNRHLSGRGCRDCSFDRARSIIQEFIKKANKIHKSKYDYSNSKYINSHTKIIISCPIHGEFLQTPNSHLSGDGCFKCGNSNMDTELFIKKANSIHKNKYDYSKVEYITSKTKVKIICPVHGEFLQNSAAHLRGQQCFRCNGTVPLSQLEFVTRCNIIHKNVYDYSLVHFRGTKHFINIICPKHGVFKQKASKHIYDKTGCPKCVAKFSKKERKWIKSFNNKNIKVNHTLFFKSKRIVVDGFNKETNTIYEFYGDFWHGNPDKYDPNDINPMTKTTFGELYSKTQTREAFLIKKGYKIIKIWENDWDK